MFSYTLLISLLLPYLVYSISGKYFRSITQFTRSNAKAFCEGEGTTLATILKETDQHDARDRTCDTTLPDGCWIGLKREDVTWIWDDGSSVTSYGFTPAVAPDATMPDTGNNPWANTGLAEPNNLPNPAECVRLEADIAGAAVNDVWADASCATPLRHAMCNRKTPETQLFCYEMTSDAGIGDWESNAPSLTEQPYDPASTPGVDRCMYNPNGSPNSVILDPGCWAVCGATSDPETTLTHIASTKGYGQCQLQFNIDPWALTPDGGGCHVEVTNDITPGGLWQEVGNYDSDDAQTEFINLGSAYSDQESIGIRVRIENRVSSCCYFNNFYLRCNEACTPTGGDCTDHCECCEDLNVCRTVPAATNPTCEDCIGLAQGSIDSPACQSNDECCFGEDNEGVVCGTDNQCCIVTGFDGCSNDAECCGETYTRCDTDDNTCKRCIDIDEGDPCKRNSDCCSYDGPFGILCGANDRCCKSKGFDCTPDENECCDGLSCNKDGKCDCTECKKVSVSSYNTDICSTVDECCGVDTIDGLICGKKHKCCITESFECQYSKECCDKMICKSSGGKKQCMQPSYKKYGGGGGHKPAGGHKPTPKPKEYKYGGDYAPKPKADYKPKAAYKPPTDYKPKPNTDYKPKPVYKAADGHNHHHKEPRSGVWSGNKKHYAEQQEGFNDNNMNDLDVVSDGNNNKNSKGIWDEYRYLYLIISWILFANIMVGVWCFYRNKMKQKQSAYDINTIHHYTKTDVDESENEEL